MVRLEGFKKLTNINNALEIFLNKVKVEKFTHENAPLSLALNRVVAEDYFAPFNLPQIDRSAVDGYAVKAKDVFNASSMNPVRLKLVKKSKINRGETVKVWTGSPMPTGADAAIMLEYAREVADNIVEILSPETPGGNVSRKGSDVKAGETFIRKGTLLKPHHLALLAAFSIRNVKVREKPKVAVITTGSELVEIGAPLIYGKIVDTNRIMLEKMIEENYCQPVALGIAKDEPQIIESKLKKALAETQIVLVTGGTSVGVSDLVPNVINQLGKPGLIVHGIAMRPGKPTGLASIEGKPVILLPGNPVAAFFAFEVFAKPLLSRFLGIECKDRPFIYAKISRRVATVLGTRVFLRVKFRTFRGELYADPIVTAGSSMISSLTNADGYVVVSEERESLEKDEQVQVYLL
jgi:molybdenum cofactor synthesis domain-containing protein